MINLRTFFRNAFDTKEISNDNIRKFAQTHISRLRASNPNGDFDDIQANTELALTDFENALLAMNLDQGVQQGRTLNVDEALSAFKIAISRGEGHIRSLYGTDSDKYQEFFPYGLTEYGAANKSNADRLMNYFASVCLKYETEVGNDFATQFQTLYNNYLQARTDQLDKIGNVEADRTQVQEKRKLLNQQLMKNLLFIASFNVGKTDMLEDFFDQSFIRSESHPDDGSMEGAVAPNSTVNIEDTGIQPDTEFTLTNTGIQPLTFGIMPAPDAPVADGIDVLPGVSLKANYLQLLGSSPMGSVFLNVSNHNPIEGKYSVMIL